MPQSKTHEVIFWEHSTLITPRPITLWLEPVITIAAVARLHLDYGWPVDCLGMQSEDSAFDVMAFKPDDLKNEHIAGGERQRETARQAVGPHESVLRGRRFRMFSAEDPKERTPQSRGIEALPRANILGDRARRRQPRV